MMFGRLVRRVRMLANRRFDGDLDEEMRLHVELRAERERARGATASEAGWRARRRFGGALQLREASRDAWGWRTIDTLSRAVRHALRGLGRRPAFAAAAIATLALVLGANIAIFTLVDRVVLHPLDVPDPASLVTIARPVAQAGGQLQSQGFSWIRIERVRTMADFQDAAVSSASSDEATRGLTVSVEGVDSTMPAKFVSANYFRVLGLRPAMGRDFTSTDDRPSASYVGIASAAFWRSALGGRSAAVGRTIRIGGRPVTVIGVAPDTFLDTEFGVPPPALFLPLSAAPSLAPDLGRVVMRDGGMSFPEPGAPSRASADISPASPIRVLNVLARIEPRHFARAQAELRAQPAAAESQVVPLADTMVPIAGRVDLRQFSWLLVAAVGLTLLIGCANLAGLFVTRADERAPEVALRAALGASRSRLVLEVLVETALVCAAGCAAAFGVSAVIHRVLSTFVLPGGIPIASIRGGVDVRTGAFAAAATACAALLIATGPAMAAAKHRLAMRLSATTRTTRSPRGARLLLALQVGSCVVLVCAATLFLRSLGAALSTNVGFAPAKLIGVSVVPPLARTGPWADGSRVAETFAGRVRTMAGVSWAAAGPLPIVQGSDFTQRSTPGRPLAIAVDGRPFRMDEELEICFVGHDYFEALGQPLLLGRAFRESDSDGSSRVVVLNAAAARRFWPDTSPLDHQLTIPSPSHPLSVVGVVANVALRTLRDTDALVAYVPRSQNRAYLAGLVAGSRGTMGSNLVVRVTANAPAAASAIARAAKDQGLQTHVMTFEERLNGLLMPQRIGRGLLMGLGGLALVLTIVGVHGLVTSLVVRGRQEIGIRRALGANARDILGGLLRRVFLPLALGATVGAAAASLIGRMVDRFMYGTTGSDPAAIGGAVVLVLFVGVLAAVVPALRALRIDPIETLRSE